jgi:hypothetical protein
MSGCELPLLYKTLDSACAGMTVFARVPPTYFADFADEHPVATILNGFTPAPHPYLVSLKNLDTRHVTHPQIQSWDANPTR